MMKSGEIHDLNRLMAEVCGVSIFPVAMMMGDGQDKLWWAITNEKAHVDGDYVWSPCTDHNQMALVKEKLRELVPAHSLRLHWGGSQWIVTLRIYNGGEFQTIHESELHAFALAVGAWWKEKKRDVANSPPESIA